VVESLAFGSRRDKMAKASLAIYKNVNILDLEIFGRKYLAVLFYVCVALDVLDKHGSLIKNVLQVLF